MKLLALDTSSVACSVALTDGDDIVERHEERPREHTRSLMPMIRDVLAESGLKPADLDAIVLGNGPGSFIGMRIAASVAQGLAFAAGVPVAAVSSMLAVAIDALGGRDADEAVVTQDAHLQEVYLGIYRCTGGKPIPETVVERLSGQEAIAELDAAATGRRIAAGFGWQRYPALLAANAAALDRVSDILYPRARHLFAPGAAVLRRGGGRDPADVDPAYLRHKVATVPGSST